MMNLSLNDSCICSMAGYAVTAELFSRAVVCKEITGRE